MRNNFHRMIILIEFQLDWLMKCVKLSFTTNKIEKICQIWSQITKLSNLNWHRILRKPEYSSVSRENNWYVSNIILYWNGKVDSLPGWWTLQKILITSTNALDKNCSELHFLQKTEGSVSLSLLRVKLEIVHFPICGVVKN